MVARVNIPNPQIQAEEQLQRMEAEAEAEGESSHFVLASMHWSRPTPDVRRREIGRELYVERQFLGGLRYRRFMDCGWINTPDWAFAHILREEALMMLSAYYSEQAVPA